MTGKYGPRIHPITKKAGHHNGIDYGGKRGTNILCPANGTVTSSGLDAKGYGNYVGVTLESGHVLVFAHLDLRLVKKGDKVKQGSVIGKLGSTGASTGPHLHFQINKPGGGVRGKNYWGNPDDFNFWEGTVDKLIVINTANDRGMGDLLEWKFKAPVIQLAFASQDLLDSAETIYQVGGTQIKAKGKVIYLSGKDRLETAIKVLDILK